MNPEQLEKRQVVLSAEFGKIHAEIAAISSKILSAPVEGISKLISQRIDLQNQEVGLQASLSDIRFRILEAEKQARKQIGLAERQRKEKLWVALQKKTKPCESCGSPTKILTDFPQPSFIGGRSGWEIVSDDWRSWCVETCCTKGSCLLRVRVYPDKPKED